METLVVRSGGMTIFKGNDDDDDDDDKRSSHHTPNALGHQTGVLLSRMARDLAF